MYFLSAVGLLRLSKIHKKRRAIFRLIYRYHDVFISIYRIPDGVLPEEEHRVSKNKALLLLSFLKVNHQSLSSLPTHFHVVHRMMH